MSDLKREGVKGTEKAVDDDYLKDIEEEGNNSVGDEVESIAQDIPTVELLAPLVVVISNVFFPNWDLKSEEQGLLAQGYADIVDKYLPRENGFFGVELSALITTGVILAPRIGKPRILIAESVENDKDTKDTES